MAAFRSFEYGRDISLLKSALRFAERILQQEDASQSLFSSDHRHSRTAAVTVSNKIQNAGSAGLESAVTNSRLHTAIFVNVLLANDCIGEAELEYFESVLDDFPRIGWHFFSELVSACGWREYFIQNLKTLSPRIRHRVLEAVHDISKTLPYIWSCTVSALTWSLCISPIKGISTSQDEVLSALSNLQALPSSNEASPTGECLLEDSVQFLVQLSGNCSSSDMKMMDWALSLVNVILDFLQSVFEPTEFSLLNPNLWLTNFVNTEEKAEHDFYLTSLCCFRVLNDLAWPDVCQLLSHADCLLFAEVKKALVVFGEMLAQEQSIRHSLCLTHDFCASSLIDGNERNASFKVWAHEDLWHLIRKMQCFLNSLETVKKHCGAQSPLLAGLKDFVKKWDHEGVDLTVYGKETQISAIESILKEGTIPPTPAFIIWIVSHESLLTHQWICDILNDHLNLLSHPELFHRLCRAALCSDANTCIKKLVLKMCSASPPKLQEAMLFYVFSSKSFSDDSLPLKLTDFESLLTEKLNLISDTDLRMDSEDRAKVFSEFASLCMQSPTEVIEAVVDMAVTDGCTTAVAQLLMHLGVVCHYKKQWYDGQDLLGSIVLDTFQRLRSETSKHQDNFTCLIKELVGHSDVLNCDWFLTQIVYCVDLAGAGGRHFDSFFPLQVTMAIAPNISTHYVVPMARILLQMLDEACIELNGARKQKVLHFLHAYLSLDICTSQADVLCNSNLSHAAIKCLLKKKCIVHEAFGVPIQREELVLLDAKKWRNECQKVASQFPECSLTELLMPHFCLWLAGATSEEWEILSAQLRRALDIDAGHSVSAAIFIQELVMCLIGCKSYVAVGNWSYLFTCFANTVMECLKRTKELSEEDLREILLALVFALSSLPSRCLKQELLLLVDVTQWMKTSVLGGELAKLFGEALATHCYHSDFVSGLVKTSVHKLLAHKANQS
ncbi:uncharacterized protein LOC119436523 isoform X1 [Dermacentor silvarum]|uniref:uncharacterized protein LOC119436523 isoform X1 n=2 Tax=Dermacentor silvarum TaxID=543639 RepID=UPI001899E68A|nr:uncharacterized protein LOC119436523 isoform X1 [Dermacentor silvarum]